MTTAELTDQPNALSNHPRNPGIPLDPAMFEGRAVNRSAAERRAATLTTRRSVKKTHQAAWLVNAIRCIDLTTLAGDDTEGRVQRLCAKARNPLRADLVKALGLEGRRLTTGAVCVYPEMVAPAVKALEGSGIPVASVATGFPAGLTPMRERLAEIHRRSIDELEDGLSKDLIEELERLDLPFDSADGPPTTSELRIAQAQLVGWLEGLFHGVQTAIVAQQAMAQQMAGRGQLPPGVVPPGMTPADGQPGEKQKSDRDNRGTGNYL